jgi:hypothetical protein
MFFKDMKLCLWISPLLLAVALTFSGCGKSEEPPPAGASVQTIDATKLRPAFESATPQAKALVDDAMMSIRDSNYQRALADLDKLSGLPDVTEAQKKAAADLSDQVKKKMEKLAQSEQ